MDKYAYVKYDEESASVSEMIKSHVQIIEVMLNKLPHSREKALALTKLEETFMWCGKAIRGDQIQREIATTALSQPL